MKCIILSDIHGSYDDLKKVIDVFETEPPLAPSHPLLNCKNILLTPHVAFATKESMEKRVEIVFHNIECFLNNNQINKII